MGPEPWVTGDSAGKSPGVFALGGCWCPAVLTASVSCLHQPSGDAVAPLGAPGTCSGAEDVPHWGMLPDKVMSEMAAQKSHLLLPHEPPLHGGPSRRWHSPMGHRVLQMGCKE